MIAAIFGCALCMSAIATHSIGPFIKPIEAEMGWSRTAIQASLFFGQGVSAIGVVITGTLLERMSSRSLALIGMAGTGVGLLLVSISDSLAMFYAGYCIAALVGSGSGFIIWSRAITARFHKRRGLALAVALSGTGASGVILPPLLVWTIGAYGWRAGYIALAALPLLIALPIIFLLFRPHDDGAQLTAKNAAVPTPPSTVRAIEVFANYRYWIRLLSVFCVYFSVVGILPNLIPALTDAGIAPERAALAQVSFALAMIVGRLLVGYLSDHYWAPAIGALFLTPPAIGCYLLVAAPTLPVAIFAAVLIGAATGAELDLMAFLTSRYFKPHVFARAYSYLYAAVAVAGGTAPMAFAAVYDRNGSYGVSFAAASVMFLIGGPMLLLLGKYPEQARPGQQAATTVS